MVLAQSFVAPDLASASPGAEFLRAGVFICPWRAEQIPRATQQRRPDGTNSPPSGCLRVFPTATERQHGPHREGSACAR